MDSVLSVNLIKNKSRRNVGRWTEEIRPTRKHSFVSVSEPGWKSVRPSAAVLGDEVEGRDHTDSPKGTQVQPGTSTGCPRGQGQWHNVGGKRRGTLCEPSCWTFLQLGLLGTRPEQLNQPAAPQWRKATVWKQQRPVNLAELPRSWTVSALFFIYFFGLVLFATKACVHSGLSLRGRISNADVKSRHSCVGEVKLWVYVQR